jgi:hypothetical protein
MTRDRPRDVELVGHRCRSHCRPGAEAGPESGTQVPEPMWDRGTELSHLEHRRLGGQVLLGANQGDRLVGDSAPSPGDPQSGRPDSNRRPSPWQGDPGWIRNCRSSPLRQRFHVQRQCGRHNWLIRGQSWTGLQGRNGDGMGTAFGRFLALESSVASGERRVEIGSELPDPLPPRELAVNPQQ